MRAIAILLGLVLALAAGASRAADLPNLDGQFCASFIKEHPTLLATDPAAEDRCLKNMDAPMKGASAAMIQRTGASKLVVDYCGAAAKEEGEGYNSFMRCLIREVAATYFYRYQLDAWNYCSTFRGSRDSCEASELSSRQFVKSEMAAVTRDQLVSCLADDSQRSFLTLAQCLREQQASAR